MPYAILLVDDDNIFRGELKAALSDEYNVFEAANGHEALDMLKKPNEIDLVILDVMMPGLKGTEVLKEMKRVSPELGIIILTGFSTKDVAIDALKGRADDYIEKPFKLEKLNSVMENLLKSKNGELNINECDVKGKVEHVKRFVERNYHKKISLKDAATVVGLSPKYLSRVFRQETGNGLSDYKSRIKIDMAKSWLKSTGYNVNQIADRLGYQNVESFIRTFKKYARCTPTDYKKVNGS
ncbi:MAG: response regulator [Deltaproteobacteria bacterium]|nr:response regulator [Deltaproteobacteria bacterium]